MSQRPYKPAGIAQLFPYLVVKDGEKAIEFYEKAFGFKAGPSVSKNGQGKVQHAEMKFGDATIMFAPEAACAEMGSDKKSPATLGVKPSLSLYVYCEDVDALHRQAVTNGAKSTMAPMDGFWGDRFCTLIDPDGHEWMFATNIADHKPQN